MSLPVERPCSIKDVAKLAGVSISTVSNVLNGTKPVSRTLTKRVQKAVKDLNYATNPVGRQLRTGRSRQIAFLLPCLTSVFFPQVLKSVQSAADAAGYTVSVFGTKGELAQERRIINMLRGQGYEGIFLDSCADVDQPETAEYLDFLHAINFAQDPMHIICVETAISPKLDAVVVNDAEEMAKATEYLIQKGRRHFVHIAAPTQYMHAKNRKKGFLTALMLSGIPVDPSMVIEGNFTCRSGYDAMAQFLASGREIDAVVAGNDQMAVGALCCLKEHGRRVPGDVMLAGFNDNVSASLISPSLTTIHIPKSEMGICAFEMFLQRAAKDDSPRKVIQLSGELVIRNSTDPDLDCPWNLDW